MQRLYRSLVRDQRIAVVAEGFSGFPGVKYPGLFAFYAVPMQGHSAEEMSPAIHKELDKLKTTDVTDAELDGARPIETSVRSVCAPELTSTELTGG